MPTALVSVDRPSGAIALTTTLTRLDVGGRRIDWVYINADADIAVVTDPVLDTGNALPSNFYRIPAGVCHPIRVTRARILLAVMPGGTTATAYAFAMADEPTVPGPPGVCL